MSFEFSRIMDKCTSFLNVLVGVCFYRDPLYRTFSCTDFWHSVLITISIRKCKQVIAFAHCDRLCRLSSSTDHKWWSCHQLFFIILCDWILTCASCPLVVSIYSALGLFTRRLISFSRGTVQYYEFFHGSPSKYSSLVKGEAQFRNSTWKPLFE